MNPMPSPTSPLAYTPLYVCVFRGEPKTWYGVPGEKAPPLPHLSSRLHAAVCCVFQGRAEDVVRRAG